MPPNKMRYIMKKTIPAFGLMLMLLASASCCNNHRCANGTAAKGDVEETYTGILPGADTSGIHYTLTLDYDDDSRATTGDYDLLMSYTTNDGRSVTDRSEGDFSVVTRENETFVNLSPEFKFRTASAMTFKITSDSTLLMVNDNYEAPDSVAHYTLHLSHVDR